LFFAHDFLSFIVLFKNKAGTAVFIKEAAPLFSEVFMNKAIVPDDHSHTILVDGKKHTWYAKRLWSLAAALPEFEYEVAQFDGYDQDYWFGDRVKPTINKVIEHYNRIQNADYSYPIIISESGLIMDGVHRILRAHIEGRKTVRAVRFERNPEPDLIREHKS
jgi:hypothetical protein